MKKNIHGNKKHGMYGTKTYGCWRNMLSRCRNKNYFRYKDYGGRGITVCDKWLQFSGFLEDMGEKPNNLSLDRIDNNKGYYKENCRWTTQKEQMKNTRANVHIFFKGKDYILNDLSKKIGISRDAIKRRYARGKQVNERIENPRWHQKNDIDITEFVFSKDRTKDIIKLKSIGCTLRQIGDVFGLSRQRIKQILDSFSK